MNLDELERSVLHAARREFGPSADDRERVRAELFERLGGGSSPGSPAAPFGPGGLTPSTGSGGALSGAASRLYTLGIGLIVGAMVGGWLGFGLGRHGAGARDVAVGAPVHGGPSASVAGAADGAASGELPLAVGVPSAGSKGPGDEAPFVASDRDAPRARPPLPRSPHVAEARPKSAAVEPSSSLAAELAMLQRARRALNAANGRLALGIVQDLDEQFPRGILIEERSATRVLSLCQLERVDEARHAARTFLARYPASVYAERVRRACAAASEE